MRLFVTQAKQALQVENTGDVGTKYALDVSALGPHFAAFPASGFLAANQQAQLEVTFHPRATHPDIRVDKVLRGHSSAYCIALRESVSTESHSTQCASVCMP